jgi:nitroimidazol reductase NimA-like FMN-containing flavoprotein (pyridoxamine 5'-phosphate oxidase superfamily)
MGHQLKTRKTPGPTFRDLTREESETLLARYHVGRLAFSFHDSVDIRPIHYVFDDGWLYGRTSPGDKLVTLRHKQWMAFEDDDVKRPLDWKSVVVHGTFYLLRNEGSVHDVRLYEKGLAAVRRLAPDALTDRDQLGFRTEVFGISIDSITGRSCSTKVKT